MVKGLKEYESIQKLHKKHLRLVEILPWYSLMLKNVVEKIGITGMKRWV